MKWYIMAAGSWMKRPSVEKIIKEGNRRGVITVATINRRLKGNQQVFILGSGDSAYGETNSTNEFTVDTGSFKRNPEIGYAKIENSIIIDENGIIDKGNGIGLDERRPLWVFK